MNPFIIDVSSLIQGAESVREIEVSGELSSIEFGGALVEFVSPLRLVATLRKVNRGLSLRGGGQVEARLRCSRCLKSFSYSLKFKAIEVFAQPDDLRHLPNEVEAFPITKGRVDLESVLRELIVLNLPFRPLCSENCQGICPHCGKDLNVESCHCQREVIDVRWNALKKLKEP
jgi:uncharacterized protein